MSSVGSRAIVVKSEAELACMRRAGSLLAKVLELLVQEIRPGLTTSRLDALAEREIRRRGAVPSFKGYRGYPACVCVSVNEEVVHGIPGERALVEGDIVSLDVGAVYQGYQADAAVTVPVGEVSPLARRLMDVTRGALEAGIGAAKAGSRLGDISAAIQQHAEGHGFSVVREYVGHGIGRDMHEEPQVPNYGLPGKGPLLKAGMPLALEPMVNVGSWRTRVGADGWTVSTMDGSLSAHFEHTIAIGEGGGEVLTMVRE